jgi:hypothetical protein
MLAVGCTGLNNEKKAPESAAQDTAWKESLHNYSLLLKNDFENVGTNINDTKNTDYTTLAIIGQNTIDDSNKALDENNQYNLSAKYQDAQKEWVLALEDSKSAGKYMIMVADDGKKGNVNSENVQNVISFRNSAQARIKRTETLIQIADRNF